MPEREEVRDSEQGTAVRRRFTSGSSSPAVSTSSSLLGFHLPGAHRIQQCTRGFGIVALIKLARVTSHAVTSLAVISNRTYTPPTYLPLYLSA